MSDSNKNVVYHDEGFVVVKDDFSVTPLDCPVCGYFMTTSTDAYYWDKLSCCEECGVKWAEGIGQEKWKSGWRPDKEELEAEIKKRLTLVKRLKLSLE